MHLAFLADDLADAHELARRCARSRPMMSLRSSPARLRMPFFWYSKRTWKSPCLTRLQDLEELLDLVAAVGGEAVPLGDRHRRADGVHHRRAWRGRARRPLPSAVGAHGLRLAGLAVAAVRRVAPRACPWPRPSTAARASRAGPHDVLHRHELLRVAPRRLRAGARASRNATLGKAESPPQLAKRKHVSAALGARVDLAAAARRNPRKPC